MFYIEAVVINLHCLLDRMWNHPGGDIYGGGGDPCVWGHFEGELTKKDPLSKRVAPPNRSPNLNKESQGKYSDIGCLHFFQVPIITTCHLSLSSDSSFLGLSQGSNTRLSRKRTCGPPASEWVCWDIQFCELSNYLALWASSMQTVVAGSSIPYWLANQISPL